MKNADNTKREQLTEKRNRIKTIEEKIPALDKRIDELHEEEKGYEERKMELMKEKKDLDDRIRYSDHEIAKAKTDYGQFAKRQNQAQSAFGSFVPYVRRQILNANRAGAWRGAPPIGPIGDLMKPLKTDYLGISESLLSSALNTYLYFHDNDKDSFK